MTGHGIGTAPLSAARLIFEVRSVNHRYLDVRVRLPGELLSLAGAVEALVRKSLRRGRVDVSARLEGRLGSGALLDRERARAAYAELCELRDELRADEPVPLSLLACVPDLFGAAEGPSPEDARKAAEDAATMACDAVWEMRSTEGAKLAQDISMRLVALEGDVEAVSVRTPEVVIEQRARLERRLERLLEGASVMLDQGRLEHEVAILADKADVTEELTRLRSHIEQTRGLLASDEPTLGKRLDFLLQEMSREVNTIGSKSSDAALAQRVVEMKARVSRMREQAQNIL